MLPFPAKCYGSAKFSSFGFFTLKIVLTIPAYRFALGLHDVVIILYNP